SDSTQRTMQPIVVSISPRGEQILSFLMDHTQVGPSDLVDAYGGSQPTWSRELKSLDGTGLVIKRGQKRYLTEFGRSYLQQSSRG
ncbi:MAG: helix-turn-helix transcriptional regulator, partial [Atopobiaceae bacterium]|nr:helix-turn-helix transcriptional regulator [Atopobiaceae bacterium]